MHLWMESESMIILNDPGLGKILAEINKRYHTFGLVSALQLQNYKVPIAKATERNHNDSMKA